MSTAILRALRLVSAHLQHHDIASQIILSNSNQIGRNFDVPFKHNTEEKSWVLRCVTMYNKCQCQEAVCLSDCGIHGLSYIAFCLDFTSIAGRLNYSSSLQMKPYLFRTTA